MSALSAKFFHDEAAAYEWLEGVIWPDGPVCPHCGGFDRITAIKPNVAKKVRMGLKRCGQCKKQFTVTVGTVFERSHVKLHLWLQAAHLICSSKKGMSAHQIHRTLGVTYRTAWFMMHRLREAMREGKLTLLGGEGMTVEADETYVGGKERNKHRSKRDSQHIGGVGKEMVFSLVERGGRVRSHHMTDISAKNLRPHLEGQIKDSHKTRLMTDGEGQYRLVGSMFKSHDVVNHGIGEYVRGDAYTNTIESYFAILKRGIVGTYHHVSAQHLKRYVGEFDFRYNERSALGVGDGRRTETALRGIVGKRLTYRDSSASAATA
ncbi:MAG: IS1595 family transposase [Caulobacteraceae bacterium]